MATEITTESGGLYAEFCTPGEQEGLLVPPTTPLWQRGANAGTCSIEGCGRPAFARGWCGKHYQRWNNNREGHGAPHPRLLRPQRLCSIAECNRLHDAHGYCKLHHSRWQRTGDPLGFQDAKADPRLATIESYSSPSELAKVLGVSKQRAHQLLHREAHRAQKAVNEALAAGRIAKPKRCARCEKRTPALEAHPWDYRERLDVRWLCVGCHNIVHPHGNSTGRRGLAQAARHA